MFANDIFIYDFQTCRDISNEDINDTSDIFSNITVAQGKIQLYQLIIRRSNHSLIV